MDEREIFVAALDLIPQEERQAYLNDACGEDAGLRQRVDALLLSHQEAGSFLEHPALADELTIGLNPSTDLAKVMSSEGAASLDMAEAESEIVLNFLESCSTPDRLGRIGAYEVIEFVGRGGMGIVLKGYDTRLQRVVALKLLAPELSSNATARKRFLREARAAAAITHDHVVTIHAVEESERLPAVLVKMPYLVMEYVSGQSLQERIDKVGPLEVAEILRIGMQMAAGLAAAHAHGIVHRDIKPANILLENGVERVKITDFGLARAVDDVGMTRSGMVAGTPQYMSPEQARGEAVDQRTDLFSLGCVMYAMCTGRSPFRADSTLAAIRRICDDTPRPLQEVNPAVPGWLVEIINKLLAKAPDKRFQSAAEVAELLGEYLAHVQQPSFAPKPVGLGAEATEFVRQSARRAGARGWLIAAVLLLMLGGLASTEVTGVTNVREFVATVLRIRTPEGMLVVEVDDPEINVTIDGEEITLSNVGPHEIRLSPGRHRLQATKGGASVRSEWVTITRGGKQVVKIGLERADDLAVEGASAAEGLRPIAVLKGHANQVRSVAFSPDGKTLASGSFDSEVKLWDVESFEERATLQGHTFKVNCVAFAPDGNMLASASLDGTVKLWDVADGSELETLRTSSKRACLCVAFSPDHRTLASGYADTNARLWDLETYSETFELGGHQNSVETVDFNSGGTLLAAGSAGGAARFWNVASGEEHEQLLGSQSAIVVFSPEGERVARAGPISTGVIISQLGNPENVTRVELGLGPSARGMVWGLAFSPDGQALAIGWGNQSDQSGGWGIWDTKTGNEICSPADVSELVWSVSFAPNGKLLATAGVDSTVKLWNVTGVLSAASAQSQAAPVTAVTETRRFAGHTEPVGSLVISGDGSLVLSGGNDGSARVWDAASGEEIRALDGHQKGSQVRVAVASDGERAATGDWTGTIRLWDLDTGEKTAEFEGHADGIYEVAFSPDGRTLLSTGCDSVARIWDVESGTELHVLRGHASWVSDGDFSPDGQCVLTSGLNGTVRLWDATSGEEIRQLPEHPAAVHRVAVSPDGRLAASACKDGMVRVFDLETGAEVCQCTGHCERVFDVKFTPDSRFVLSGSYDKTLRVWNVETGEELARASAASHVLNTLAVFPDGRHVASAGGVFMKEGSNEWVPEWDYAVRVWRLPESLWLKEQPREEGSGID